MSFSDASSDWQSLYEAAMRETDRAKLAQRIALARDAVLVVIEKSVRNPALADQRAMDNALRNLRKRGRSLDGATSEASA